MTESFTQLKGFNNFNDLDLLNQVQQSIISFFDWGFLDKGAYTNIYLGQSDINSNDQSKLRKVYDSNYTNGQVWEAFHHNLVWESGMTTGTPIHISGVYVDGSFKTSGTAGYEHYIDYERGRVVFDSAISATTVRMEYSYKNILFDRLSIYPEIANMQTDVFSFKNYSSFSSGDYINLNRKQLPLVAIEVTPQLSYKPVSLGTGANWVDTDIIMHIFDQNEINVNKLMSYISLQKEKTIYMLDINMMVTSGAFPTDYRGALTSDPKTFPDLVNGGYRDSQLYFADSISRKQPLIGGNIYYGTVRFTTETISAL